jgi:CheY-like chemotaxis protein
VTIDYQDGALITKVADTGIGMSPEVQAGLFTTFTQADTSTTRRFGGTGLGLSICRRLAELMGGSISLASEEGRGSTFVFTIPLDRVGEARSGCAVSEEMDRPEMLDLRVLAAEDNSVNQLVLKTLLHQIGIAPLLVDDGERAVQAWEAEEWDVILMDVQMPVMDGPTAVRAIRAREVRLGRRRTPIIALTANAMSHQVADYLACGMDGFVAKPIEASKLVEALNLALTGEAMPELL